MDIGAAFTYFKRDEQWINKFLIGSLLIISIIGMVPVLGWFLEIIRRVSEDENTDELPDWEDIGAYTITGLKLYGVLWTWSIPLLVIFIPFALLPMILVLVDPSNEQVMETILVTLSMLNMCIYPIAMIFGIGMQLITNPMYAILATTGSFVEALNPVNTFRILRANVLDFILVVLIIYGLGFLILPAYLLCITIFPTMIYVYTVMGHLAGQAYKRAMEKMESQTPPPAEQSV